MRNRILYIVAAVIAVFAASSCIKNDIPYARIPVNFLTFDTEGQDAGSAIDSVLRTVTISYPEQVDIEAVKVTGYSITPGGSIVGRPFADPIDLSSPMKVTLRMYQDYQWTIIGNQNIERYFEVAGQMGTSIIDVPGQRVLVNVRDNADLSALRVVRAKLGPIGSTMVPDIAEDYTFDARQPFVVNVESYGRVSEWTIYVRTVTATVVTSAVDAWTCVAWVYGEAEAGADNGVEYRIAGSEEWTRVPAADITSDGGNFCARIAHLSPATEYEARTYSGEDYGDEVKFTTGNDPQLPNSNFDYWWLDKKVWCPWQEDGEPYWGTGNKGAATLGESNTVPTEDTPSGSGWAAKLETRFVGIGAVGKIAAGNIFVGSYVRTEGTNGVLSFGRPFEERPVKLRGQFKYTAANISHASEGYKQLIGQPDTAIVWMALIDSAEPFEIRTDPKNRQLFDPSADYVVAYGKMNWYQTVSTWTPFEFELKYNSTSRRPRYILITGSASVLGDYFTGGTGSTLYLDDLVLVYDY